MSKAPQAKVDFLSDKPSSEAFERALVKHVGEVLKLMMSRLINPENVQRFRHGGDWSHPGLPDAYNAGMQQHSSEVVIKFDELVNHDVSAINRYVQKIVEDMNGQFQKMMYTTISASCDQIGNVVDAKTAGGPIEGFAAMLEKIRFGVDKDGNVKRPEIHLSPEALEKFKRAQEAASPELLQRIHDLGEQRAAEAIQEEAKRKARFARYGDES